MGTNFRRPRTVSKDHLDVVDGEAPHAALPADALDDGAEEGEVPPGGGLQLPVSRLLKEYLF